VTVTSLRHATDGRLYRAETSRGSIVAERVVIATGPFQRPVIPARLNGDLGIPSLHASAYRNPAQLPEGAVLVVGAGASGAQITEELLRAGREVFLSIGRHVRLPRRYRGPDAVWWRMAMGQWDEDVAHRKPAVGALANSGAYGGYTIDFRDFAARGAVLLGRVEAISGGVTRVAPDLAERLAIGDAALQAFCDAADAYAAREGLDLPKDPDARVRLPDPACVMVPIRHLDLNAAGVTTIIWATGYALDFSWIDLPVVDATGQPRHRRGMTELPGLYFLGLPWQTRRNSAFLNGVGADAAEIVADMVARG
jgi:putative flavoprotein involved in K+ transport